MRRLGSTTPQEFQLRISQPRSKLSFAKGESPQPLIVPVDFKHNYTLPTVENITAKSRRQRQSRPLRLLAIGSDLADLGRLNYSHWGIVLLVPQ
jgi:hypothetical protein